MKEKEKDWKEKRKKERKGKEKGLVVLLNWFLTLTKGGNLSCCLESVGDM